jgi:hypothetical protein
VNLFETIDSSGHEQVVFCHNKDAGLKAIIAIHNTYLGPALGGLRMWAYATESEAAANVDRLRERFSTGLSNTDQTFGDVFISKEVTADGRLVVATLRGQARFVIRFGIEPLLLHE